MRVWIALTSLVFVISFTVILILLLPPKKLVFAAGPEKGAYAQVAHRYAEILARDDIELDIIYSDGSAENAELMSSGKVDVALLQAGIPVEHGTAEAIGAVFFEPMLFLAKRPNGIPNNAALWKGLRIASGLPGSGTAVAFRDFREAVGLGPDDNIDVPLPYSEAIDALEKGEIDIGIFVTTVDAPYLARAYTSDEIAFVDLSYVEAISRHLEYADVVTVPSGAVSLEPVRPFRPQRALALQGRLVIDPDLHPAMVNRLTMAAKELHTGRDIITDRDTFPTIEGTGLPVNNMARQLIQDGPSAWHNLLPYWMAAQVNRTLLLVLPILLLLVPLLRSVPLVYSYFRGWQVWQHYPQIRLIEDQLTEHQDLESLASFEQQLDDLDHKIGQLKLPAAYRQTAYDARLHIDLIRKRIRLLQSAPDKPLDKAEPVSV
ncbi:TAXI family TRAP transporter solute-binding subunit [Shimia thalassica]|uniref:TAXI family TRAP transporter solute-binding subunit n=1 Tax=Shimia thalassica TaxID=1715693 RepID=UPI0026E349FC|nr:TAXI family TRAP transporter solute-binding subunit [Shimia thalassica]MDO6480273.1 TAXI family TRAP transporter solute-binding subunit [Shimia thalassica]